MTASSAITLEQALEWLENQRITLDREPFEVIRYGEWLLEHNQLHKLGNDVWAFLEQLGLAAAELGKLDLAELCQARLKARFTDSSRVQLLQGVILEAKGKTEEAKQLYEELIKKEPSNILANKRRLACFRAMPNGLAMATEGLAELVDMFPADQEAWLELASLYLQQYKYAQAAYALEELVLLAPHNSFYLLKYAETLYTSGEVAKAYKIYLRILELGEGNMSRENYNNKTDRVRGPWVRTLWGIKMCTSRLMNAPAPPKGADTQITASNVDKIDTLVTKLLLDSVYAPDVDPPAPSSSRAAARAVLAPSSA